MMCNIFSTSVRNYQTFNEIQTKCCFGRHVGGQEYAPQHGGQYKSYYFVEKSKCQENISLKIKKKQNVLAGSKRMRCEAQKARFWLLRRRFSQSLRAHSQTRKHWGREWFFFCLRPLHAVPRIGTSRRSGVRLPPKETFFPLFFSSFFVLLFS